MPDFADFAGAPDPSPASISPATPSAAGGQSIFPTGSATVPYTKWYRVWERTSPKDFAQEAIVVPFIIIAVIVHLWGSRKNRRVAKNWINTHGPVLEQEYAVVGFGGRRRSPTVDEVESEGLAKAMASNELIVPEELLKEKTAQDYATYATGRQNVAFTDVSLTLLKRYNPLVLAGEYCVSFLFDSFPAPAETMEAIAYAFDGREAEIVPVGGGKQGQEVMESRRASSSSTYGGFVWAIVNKEGMKRLREERYDVSLTSTKDHPKLPVWATVMTESSEVTELLLTPELISAVEAAGELLEYLIVTDQPLDKPVKCVSTPRSGRVIRGWCKLTLRLDWMRLFPRSASTYLFVSLLRHPTLARPYQSSRISSACLTSSLLLRTSGPK